MVPPRNTILPRGPRIFACTVVLRGGIKCCSGGAQNMVSFPQSSARSNGATPAERTVARRAFDLPLSRELAAVVMETKTRAEKIQESADPWDLERYPSDASRGSAGAERPAMPHIDRIQGILAQRLRTKFVDREKEITYVPAIRAGESGLQAQVPPAWCRCRFWRP